MSRRVILRPDVPGDLHKIVELLDKTDPAISDQFLLSVFSALDGLALMPGKGSLKDFRLPILTGVRSWTVPGFRNYVIYYRTDPDAIVIIAVLHGARNVPRLLKQRAR